MIYVTGDLHGDIERLRESSVRRLKKGDTLLVCGDFGFIWQGGKEEQKALEWIGRQRYNTLFIEGCYDNLELLAAYPQSEWQGGQVRRICGNLLYGLRGSIFTLESKRIFVMGGGELADPDGAMPWAAQGLPSRAEMELAQANLADHRYVVDYIITHDCPTTLKSSVGGSLSIHNQLYAFFDAMVQRVRHKGWYFGRYHIDKLVPPHYHAVYKDVLALQ